MSIAELLGLNMPRGSLVGGPHGPVEGTSSTPPLYMGSPTSRTYSVRVVRGAACCVEADVLFCWQMIQPIHPSWEWPTMLMSLPPPSAAGAASLFVNTRIVFVLVGWRQRLPDKSPRQPAATRHVGAREFRRGSPKPRVIGLLPSNHLPPSVAVACFFTAEPIFSWFCRISSLQSRVAYPKVRLHGFATNVSHTWLNYLRKFSFNLDSDGSSSLEQAFMMGSSPRSNSPESDSSLNSLDNANISDLMVSVFFFAKFILTVTHDPCDS